MAKALGVSGIVFWVFGLLALVPMFLPEDAEMNVSHYTLEFPERSLKAVLAINNFATLGSCLMIVGAVFICSAAIVKAVQGRD